MGLVLELDEQAAIVPPKAGDKEGVETRERVVQKNNSAAGARMNRQLLELADQTLGFDAVGEIGAFHKTMPPVCFVPVQSDCRKNHAGHDKAWREYGKDRLSRSQAGYRFH